jgi:hypothetical protein
MTELISSAINGVRQQLITWLVQQTFEAESNWCPLQALNAIFA